MHEITTFFVVVAFSESDLALIYVCHSLEICCSAVVKLSLTLLDWSPQPSA